jgi:alpha-beta hydrolase superfamily lysophospholipase
MTVFYDSNTPGDWGSVPTTTQVQYTTETLIMPDSCKLFLRGWQTESRDVLLIMHGLGAHSGWFIDMGNELAKLGLTVYAVDHRGFGRSGGLPGHVERFDNYVEDLVMVIEELRKRHIKEGQRARFYILGHSMGGIFATYLAAKHDDLLDGVLFLNPWVKDSVKIPLSMTLGIFVGGLLRSKRYWHTPGGPEGMTTNPQAVKMLEADPYWRRARTANFYLQIFRMRLQILKLAKSVNIPALVMQAAQDKSVIPEATRQLYTTLASRDKTWKLYPDYAHDTELEVDRTLLDRDIVEWIQAHTNIES